MSKRNFYGKISSKACSIHVRAQRPRPIIYVYTLGVCYTAVDKHGNRGVRIACRGIYPPRRRVRFDNIRFFQSFLKKRLKTPGGKRTLSAYKIQNTRVLHASEKPQKIQRHVYIYKMPVVQKCSSIQARRRHAYRKMSVL